MLEISLLHNKPSDRANPFFDVLFDYVDFHAYGAVQEEEQSEGLYSGLSGLEIGGIDLTNTYLDFIINRTGGAYELSIRLTRRLNPSLCTSSWNFVRCLPRPYATRSSVLPAR